jgi:colanic acid/amylovoran biosynthesis protein
LSGGRGGLVPPAHVVLLHGVNGWNTGDRGLLEVTVRRLREALGPDTRIDVEDSFLGAAPDHEAIATRLDLNVVPPLLPLRRIARASRGRWLGWFAAAVVGAIATRLAGRRAFRLLPRQVRPLLAAMAEADVVVSKPGGHLHATADHRLPSPAHFATILTARLLGRPVVIYGQTIGPFANPLAARLATAVLAGVTAITARDPETKEWLDRLPRPLRGLVRLTADEAFLLEPRVDASSDPWSPDRRPRLAVTAINWRYPGEADPERARLDYESALAEACRWFVDVPGGEVRLLKWLSGGHREDDTAVLERLADAIGRPGHVAIVGPYAADVAAGVLGGADVVVATRLHSAIFAMAAGTPAIAIGYLPKTRAIMSMADAADRTIPITSLSGSVVRDRLAAVFRDREAHRQSVAASVRRLSDAARENAETVRDIVEAERARRR